jgi:molecular chaperone IbpA
MIEPPLALAGVEALLRCPDESAYPPYDVERVSDDRLRICLAVAGFSPQTLSVLVEPNRLTVSGRKPRRETNRHFLHHGLALRPFERRFELDDGLAVETADYAAGLLTIDLRRESPGERRPRRLGVRPLGAPAAGPPSAGTRRAA